MHAWAWEGDADLQAITSNETSTEWPRGSGKILTFPEVDRCGWFDVRAAHAKINPAQAALIERLETIVNSSAAER